MSDAAARERYGRHKAIAILVTFVLGLAAVRILAPEWQGSLPWAFAKSPKRAFDERASNIPVQAHGVIEAAAPDTLLAGGRAPRWRVRTADGHPFTWLAVPGTAPPGAAAGDSLHVRGRYVWDPAGGTVVTGEPGRSGLARVGRTGGD